MAIQMCEISWNHVCSLIQFIKGKSHLQVEKRGNTMENQWFSLGRNIDMMRYGGVSHLSFYRFSNDYPMENVSHFTESRSSCCFPWPNGLAPPPAVLWRDSNLSPGHRNSFLPLDGKGNHGSTYKSNGFCLWTTPIWGWKHRTTTKMWFWGWFVALGLPH